MVTGFEVDRCNQVSVQVMIVVGNRRFATQIQFNVKRVLR